jgi:2-desacetyl-2-hydroxyethyl bacteriochlorophyllide A dehydrogenase
VRAAVFRGVGRPLAIERLPDPSPGAREIVLRISRCGICGTDLHMTDGTALVSYPIGGVPGHEVAGEVVAIGREVSRVAVGDRITALPFKGCGSCAACVDGRPVLCAQMTMLAGGFAEYMLSHESVATKLPRTLSMSDGALIEPLAVGLHGISMSRINPGARVLIIGAGPIGLAALFWARRLGAARIVVTAGSRRRESLARKLGADDFVLPESAESWPDLVSQALGGLPDLIVEASGVQEAIARAISCVRPGGSVTVLGLCMQADSFRPAAAVWKELRMHFAMAYNLQEFEHVARVLDSGAVEATAMITDVVSLDALPSAFEALRQRTHQCKVMVEP